MIKFVLIIMLVSNNTGEIKNVQRPEGFKTREDCENVVKNYRTDLPGHHIEFACLPGHAYTPI